MSLNRDNESSKYSSGLNAILLAVLAVTAFFVFTNGIPFIQIGWLKELSKKAKYVHLMRLFVLTFSLFLLFCILFLNDVLRKTWIYKKIQCFSKRQMHTWGTILLCSYATMFTALGFARHAALETRAFDLGIFAQSVWATLHGQFLFSSLKDHICLLGDHFSPLLLVTVPFYALWQDPRMLLILQAVAAAAFIFPLLYFAFRKTEDPWISILFALLFFFYSPTRAALREDFHPEVLIEAGIFWAFIALENKRWGVFSILALLILSAKENMCGVVFILGFYAAFFKKQWGVGLLLSGLSVAAFVSETRFLVPLLNPHGYFYGASFGHLASAKGLLTQVISFETLKYILTVFGPFLFFPFAHLPTLILTFPILAQNILSSNTLMRSTQYHYLSGMTAFLFISTIVSFSALSARFSFFRNYARIIAGIILIVGLMRSGPAEYYYFWNTFKNMPPHTHEVRAKLRSIPIQFSVLSHNNLIPQMSNRMHVYQFDYGDKPTKAQLAEKYGVDYVILDRQFWEGPKNFEESFAELQGLGYYAEYEKDGFVMLRKKAM